MTNKRVGCGELWWRAVAVGGGGKWQWVVAVGGGGVIFCGGGSSNVKFKVG